MITAGRGADCHRASPYTLPPALVRSPRPQSDILYDLFIRSNLSPYASSVLIQIILNDLRPLLSPLPLEALNFTTALLVEHKATPQLDIFVALEAWDWEARSYHKVWSNLDLVLDEIENRGGGAGRRQRPNGALTSDPLRLIRPGINVEVSPCFERELVFHLQLTTVCFTDTQMRKRPFNPISLEDDRRSVGRAHKDDLGRDQIRWH